MLGVETQRRGKVIITGTGRAGTTFLVQLLTELGEDTGFTAKNWQRSYDAFCAAGLEHDITAPDAPRIIKNPALCETLPGLLASGAVKIDHAIVPVRGLDEAARSRIWIGGHGQTPGGLWGTADPSAQKNVLADNFHRLVQTLVEHEVPVTFLAFPRFARDVDYTWQKLAPLLPGTDRKQFAAAFRAVARPELIHNFATGLPEGAGQAGRVFEARLEARRLRRRRRRIFIGAGLAGLAISLGLILS